MSSDENKRLEPSSDIPEQSGVCNNGSGLDMDTTENDNLVNDSDKDSDCDNSVGDQTKTMKESKENKVSDGSETIKKSQNSAKTGNISSDVDSSSKVSGQHVDSDVKSSVKETDPVEKQTSKSSSDMEVSSTSDKKSEMDVHMDVDRVEGKPEEQTSANMSPSVSSSSLTSSTSSLSSTSSSSSSSSLRPSTRSSSSQRQSAQQTEQTHSQGRATRLSQNPDFAAKHRKFLNRVHDAIAKNDDQTDEFSSSASSPSLINGERSNSVDDSVKSTSRPSRSLEKRRRESVSSGKLVNETDNEDHSFESDSTIDSPKKKKVNVKLESPAPLRSQLPVLEGSDRYCWRCHRDGNVILCKTCPRVYHMRCTQLEAVPQSDWVCPECTAIVYAENFDTRSAAMKSLTLEQLCNLLKYTVLRMKGYAGSEWFCKAVDQTEFPEYKNFVVHPMDLMLLEKNIKQKRYGSTEAFLADTKWILHNCVVFNTYQSKLSNIAKSLVKICRQEMGEIENCPDCYLNAHTRKDSWFIEVCRRPHIIVWAKLKGFPFWPAKAMRTNNENHVDVRFFGAHDRAWVPVNSVYLYSRNPPAAAKNKKKNNLDECILEVEQHIKKLRDRFGKFEYAPFKTSFDPENEDEQLRILLPHFTLSSNNAPLRRYNRLIGPIKSVDGGEQSENKPVEVKKEDSDKKDSKKVTTNIAKKILKENKNIFGENNNSDEAEPIVPTVENESTSNKSDDSIDKSKVVAPSPAFESNDENVKSVSVNEESQSGEPNLVFRGVTVKRQLSTVYDGGGGGDNSITADLSTEKSNASKTSDKPATSVKLRRKSSDTCVSDSSNNSINRVKVLKTYQNKTLNKNNSDKMCKTDKNLVSSNNENTEVSEKSSEVLKNSETNLILSQNSSNISNKDSCNKSSSVTVSLIDGNEKSIATDGKSKTTDESQNSKGDNISTTNIISDISDNTSNNVNDSSVSNLDVNIVKPVVILCDIKHGSKDPLSNVTVKKEVISSDENTDCENEVSNLRITSVNSLSNTISSVEKAVEDSRNSNQNDIESDCSSKDDSITEIVIDKPPPETIDLDADKSSELSVTLEDHPELILGGKPSSNVVSELHNKLMLDSTDESPLVIIDENSDAEQNQSQKELTSSISVLLNSQGESSLTSDKEQSLHQQILKSVLENNSENSNSTNNLEKTVLMNRRKSKPVKIRSRSNTSSSEDAVEELKRICEEQEAFRKTSETPSPTVEEVLDEVSGRFRRKENSSSEDPNVTITLISDDEPRKPSSKAKEIRPSVALSRNVSLTVIDNNSNERSSSNSNSKTNPKDLPTSLEMECVESDTDEPILLNETRLKPTARKTFPKPVPSLKSSSGANKTGKSQAKKELQITAISEPQVSPSNKLSVARLPTNLSGVDEIKISNTMSMKLQPSSNTNSVVVNGRASSPPLILPNSSPSIPYRNTTTTQARVLPQLQPKPPPAAAPVNAPMSGPTSVQLDNCSQKLAQRFRSMLEEMLRDLSAEGSTEATVKSLQLEMERLQWKHRQEVAELKHNTDLIIMEMRASLEAEKQRLLLETKMKCEAEKESAINETKMKQWCALCKKEALFYCCWNTAYCNYPCQQAHWPQHMSVCAQTSRTASETTITKTTTAPKCLSAPINNSSSGANKTVCFSSPNSNQQASSPVTSKPPHLPTSSSSNNIPFIPINVPSVSTCGSSTCGPGYNRPKNSCTVISTGPHSSPGNPYYPPGMSLPQNGSTNTTQALISHQSDMKLMPPPSHHQTNITYSRMINGKMHSPGPLPPPPIPHTASQLHNYRQLSVSVRPPQYFMIPRGAPAGGFYH